MPPASDGKKHVNTVGCSLAKLVRDPSHLKLIREAVVDVHSSTILATELLNLHIRRMLDQDPDADLRGCFNANFVQLAYNEVTAGERRVKSDADLRATRIACMPSVARPRRLGLTQPMAYEARNLVTVASNNVWMHFTKRVLKYVRTVNALNADDYKALTKEARRRRRLELMQVAVDVCRSPTAAHTSPAVWRTWVAAERAKIGIDAAVGDWQDKPLLFHLKAKPWRFINGMRLMSASVEAAGGRAFGLYPLRRANVPRHARFDSKALKDLLHLGASDYTKQRAKDRAKRKRDGEPPLPRDHRTQAEKENEKIPLFAGVVDLRAAGVQRPTLFDFAFTTDGVCARVQMRAKAPSAASGALTAMPKRGVWAIDQLKHAARVEDLHVVGIDPGKREIIVGVDMDDAKGCSPVRYTLQQRQRDMRSRQYADERRRLKNSPVGEAVADAEAALAGFNSRATNLADFKAYTDKRHKTLVLNLHFYSNMSHRRRRWKTFIKMQKSEERIYKKLEALKKDTRPLVLAYGSWGMVAGRPGVASNKGNPPVIGVGFMRKLAKRFVVATTPEAYTSKTCCRCLGVCGPWIEVEEKRGPMKRGKKKKKDKTIRGLRRCTERDCMIPLNRDRNGATNIGANFTRLMAGLPPIRSMSDEDLAFHRASLCVECE